jgi:phosphoribosylformylglycinamidine synthase
LRYTLRFTEAPRQAVETLLYNPLIQTAEVSFSGEARDELSDQTPLETPISGTPEPEILGVVGAETEELERLSSERLLALNIAEMRAIQDYYTAQDRPGEREGQGLPANPTDVELEMIAQTWSEHCKHKIFAARIHLQDGNERRIVDGLFQTYIRNTTERLWDRKPFLRSVFTDNSGVVSFSPDHALCFKVETHNSPSALDPYGGAITGIVGVNRDVLGTGRGAQPILNTDVLCFGYPDTLPDTVPAPLLHPRRVLDGVHRGIVDGGNQSGIPTVAGAFVFDESYTGKPLVFCGTAGILPPEVPQGGGHEPSWEKHIRPGDRAVMMGGRIGKDGIHGATFSSLALEESSPTSAVQIGDPITQRRVWDVLIEARDRGLIRSITDNGAGGLSSSLGEMARDSGGVEIDLDACPLKYPGLAAWEILVSESQERMSLAVDPEMVDELIGLAESRGVEASDIGRFTDSGFIRAYHQGRCVASLELAFLHDGLPRLELEAELPPPVVMAPEGSDIPERAATLAAVGPNEARPSATALTLALLSHPSIASREALIRAYDHEVQGCSVTKPFAGRLADAPTDGAVVLPELDADYGVSITHGLAPWIGDYDGYAMAACAVDEAMRAHVALGGDPDRAAALDNFCWSDPVQSERNPEGRLRLGQLIRTCEGLSETCLAFELPLISGKDSMKNDAHTERGRISVRPTLLVSLLGCVPDLERALSTDFKAAGNSIYVLGVSGKELGGSVIERIGALAGAGSLETAALRRAPNLDAEQSMASYRAFYRAVQAGLVVSAHDISDGGLAVALCEMALGGRLGCTVDMTTLPLGPEEWEETLWAVEIVKLFSESPGRILFEVPPESRADLESELAGRPFARIGEVTAEPIVAAGGLELDVTAIEHAFAGLDRLLSTELAYSDRRPGE